MSIYHETPQICPCGKETHRNKAYPKLGYNTYCSDTCSKKYQKENREYNKIMSDKDWLYEQRITLKKSKEIIAQELNCSTTVVDKWLKFHNITKVKYNESAPEELKDKDVMYNLYITKKKSIRQLARDFSVMPSTILYWIRKHNLSK